METEFTINLTALTVLAVLIFIIGIFAARAVYYKKPIPQPLPWTKEDVSSLIGQAYIESSSWGEFIESAETLHDAYEAQKRLTQKKLINQDDRKKKQS